MKFCPTSFSTLFISLGLATSAFAEGVLYRETFLSGPGASASGWNYHISDKAWDASTQPIWGGAPGATAAAAVNSAPSSDAFWQGFVYLPQGDTYLFWTSEYVAKDAVTAISWHQSLSNATDAVHVAVQVDANGNGRDASDPWFVSAQGFTQDEAAAKLSINKSSAQELKFAGAQWRPLNYKPVAGAAGGALALDSAAAPSALPAGPLVAFGLYAPKRTTTHTFDTFTISSPAGIHSPIPPAVTPKPVVNTTIAPLTDIPTPKKQLSAKISAKLDLPMGQVVIGGGGTFTGIYFSPAKPGEAYLTGDMVGPWHRPSAETPWELLPVVSELNPRPGFGNSSMALHPTNALIAYADLGNGGHENAPTGLWKTEDGGKTWKQVLQKYSNSNQDFKGGGARQWGPGLAVDPNDPEVIYWGTRKDGVWRTLDGGKNWTQVLNIPEGCRNVVIAPNEKINGRSKNIYVGVFEKGVYVSTDGGDTFAFDEGFKPLAVEKPSIRWMRSARDGVVYAAHDTKLARRDATGWHDVTPAGEGLYKTVAVDANDSNRVLAIRQPLKSPNGELFRSTDGGKTWTQPSKQERSVAQPWDPGVAAMLAATSIDFDPTNPKGAYVTDVFSVWRTQDAWADPVVFETQLDGAEITLTFSMATLPEVEGMTDSAVMFTGVSDIRGFRHTDIFTAPGLGQKGNSYIMAPGDWSTYVTNVDFCEADPNIVYAAKSFQPGHQGSNQAKLLRSTNNGKTWVETANPLPGQEQAGSKVAVSATEPGRAVYFPGNSQSPFFTTDGGSTWKPAKVAGTGEPMPHIYNKNSGYNFALATGSDRVDGKTFYAYQYRGKEQPGVFWVSRDGGETWTATKSDLPGANIHDSVSPVQLSATPGRAGELWLALGGGGLWHSTDFGATFTKSPEFPGSRPLLVSAGVGDPTKPGSEPAVYVYGKGADGLADGLHRSLDAGKTWQTLPRIGFENLGSYMLMADRQTFGRLYLGTPGLGIWYVQTDQL